MTITIVMTQEQARDCVTRAKQSLEGYTQALSDLYHGQGWRALGYTSFRDCVKGELSISWQSAYRRLSEFDIAASLGNLADGLSGRALISLGKVNEDERQIVLGDAIAIAKSEGLDTPSQAHIQQVLDALNAKKEVLSTHLAPYAQAMASGLISAHDGRAAVNLISTMSPVIQGYFMQLCRWAVVTDLTLLTAIANLHAQNTLWAMDCLTSIVNTGRVGNAALGVANVGNLNHAISEASAPYRQDNTQSIALSLDKRDAIGTAHTIFKEMGRDYCKALIIALNALT